MTLSFPFFLMTALLVLTSAGYAIATIGMKLASDAPSTGAYLVIGLGLCAAVVAEVALLRNAALPMVYVAIVATETMLVLLYAFGLGERLTLTQGAGALMVLGGFALVAMSE